MIEFINGAIAMGCWVAGLFFFRFWKSTSDRFFLLFGSAFWMQTIGRIFLMVHGTVNENYYLIYFFRLGAFILILIAIIDKNRVPKR
jgi:hypothetical protein